MSLGLFDLPWWGYVIVALAFTHVTIAAVTIFLHRCMAHRALDLHPIVSHFFRFWLWITTGMLTKQWTAVHRKHHARCETAEDPHSPQFFGIWRVLFAGAELYRIEAAKADTVERFGHGTPDDWLEKHVYCHDRIGIYTMMAFNLIAFGPIGLTIWAVQMAWIPFFAAGVVNGVGHYWGYRNFQPEDTSTNVVPWGILIGGEELHNNHHAYASSAKFSRQWYEFDIGWVYIRIMSMLGLADVKKIAPRLRMEPGKRQCDLATLQAVITHRYEVLARYATSIRSTYAKELASLRERAAVPPVEVPAVKRWLHLDARTLAEQDKAKLDAVLSGSRVLQTSYSLRQELAALWQRSSASKEQLVKQLEDWCARAEASGILPLQEFSRRLRSYS